MVFSSGPLCVLNDRDIKPLRRELYEIPRGNETYAHLSLEVSDDVITSFLLEEAGFIQIHFIIAALPQLDFVAQ